MNKPFGYLLCIFIVSSFCSCQKKLKPQEYVQWILDKNNGLILERVDNEFATTLRYCPSDYMALVSANGKPDFAKEFELRKSDFTGSYNFILKLANKEASDLLTYKLKNKDEEFHRIKYFSEEIQHDLYMITDQDTLSCSLCHFERTYNTSPFITLNLNFEKPVKTQQPLKIVWLDNIFSQKFVQFEVDEIFKKDLPIVKL